MTTLKPKALITGGSRGIGRSIVRRLAKDGFAVVFTWHTDQGSAAQLASEMEKQGCQALPIHADLSTVESTRAAITELDTHGPFNVIVNNATATTDIAPITELKLETWLESLTISATAPFLIIKHFAEEMSAGDSIINISSLNTVLPQAGISGYCAGKSALESLTQVAAKELAAQGITVNAIRPGVTDTDGQRAVNPDPETRATIAQMTPLGRLGQPEDIANVVAFLAGPDSRWITGEIITASGGL